MTGGSAAEDDPRARRRRFTFVSVWGVVALAIVIGFRAVLAPFVFGIVIAYVLSPVVGWIARRRVGGRAIPRWVAIVGLYVVMLTGMWASIQVTAPRLATEVRDFVRTDLPRYSREVRENWLPRARAVVQRFTGSAREAPGGDTAAAGGGSESNVRIVRNADGSLDVVLPRGGLTLEHEGNRLRLAPNRGRGSDVLEVEVLVDRIRAFGAGHAGDILNFGRGLIGGVIGGVFGFFITLMLSAYILLTEDRILNFLRSLVRPESRGAFEELLTRIDRGLSGVVRGQLVICGINGVLSAIGFAIAGLKYWPVLALIAAVFSLIPIFGAILSSIPAVLIGLSQSVYAGVFALVWVIGIHQLEANLLNPKIMGDAAKIHPVLVVFSLLAGERSFGILGALLAVPVMSLVQSVFLHWRKYALHYGDPLIATDSLTSVPAIGDASDAAPR